MRLQSHQVVIEDPQTLRDMGASPVTLTGEDGSTISFNIANDFAAREPSVVSIGTLIDLLYKAVQSGLPIPATHATVWRAIIQNTANTKEAHNFSQVHASIENAEIGAYDVEFHIRPVMLALTDEDIQPKTILVKGDSLTIETYLELSNRLQQYRHTLTISRENVLEVHIYVDENTYKLADQLATALTTADGVYTFAILNGGKVVYAPVVPAYLVESKDALIEQVKRSTNIETYPPIDEADATLFVINTNSDFDRLHNGVFLAISALEAQYLSNNPIDPTPELG